jgi:hypothetical protein
LTWEYYGFLMKTINYSKNRFLTKIKRIHRLLWWWGKKGINSVYLDFPRTSNTIFIIGAPRSGTTWISHLINYNSDYRYIFEPFHPHHCIHMHKYPKILFQRQGSENEELYRLFSSVFSGRNKCNWANRYNQKRIVTRRLVKSIHAHFVLSWIHEKFPEIPIIYILRHPLDVVSSKLFIKENTHWNFYHSLDDVITRTDIIDYYLHSFWRFVSIPRNRFEEEILLWCVQNYVALRQLENAKHLLVYYEDVVEKPFDEINRTNIFLYNRSKRIRKRKFENIYHNRFVPSGIPRSQPNASKDQFTIDQLQYAYEMLQRFGLDHYYQIDLK